MLTNRLASGGVKTEGQERKQLFHLHLKYNHLMTVPSAYNTFPLFSCTVQQPQSPAAMDIVEICCNANRPWESDVAGGFWGSLVRGWRS